MDLPFSLTFTLGQGDGYFYWGGRQTTVREQQESEGFLASKEDPTFYADLNRFLLKQRQIKTLMAGPSANHISYFCIQILAFN